MSPFIVGFGRESNWSQLLRQLKFKLSIKFDHRRVKTIVYYSIQKDVNGITYWLTLQTFLFTFMVVFFKSMGGRFSVTIGLCHLLVHLYYGCPWTSSYCCHKCITIFPGTCCNKKNRLFLFQHFNFTYMCRIVLWNTDNLMSTFN